VRIQRIQVFINNGNQKFGVDTSNLVDKRVGRVLDFRIGNPFDADLLW